ncbi:MAG: diacylglycerol kinase [Gammaproteobacteria bacterium]|nr:diacylglycerol kinase [Gammaproteobacteria bacterium]
MTEKRRGLSRILYAALYSVQGLKAAWQSEAAFRQELIACAILLPLVFMWSDNGVERALLIGSLFLVLIVELLNSAIESVVDRIGSEQHELSGRAKDIASAAVLIALIQVPVVWWLILF